MEVGTTQPRLAAILALGGTRWAGVPFGRRPGTALEADSAEIAIHVRLPPRCLLVE